MKHLFTLCLLLLIGTSFSQGNLQFNQVLTFAGSAPGGSVLTIGTVPVGKVWKIEARSMDIGQFTLRINGFQYDYIYGVGNTGLVTCDLPIWLKANDVISINVPCCVARNYFYSIIEFNIVP